jgi:hypothetical protein
MWGYISVRPYYNGPDAASAIARLGELPAAIAATRVVIVWEHEDLMVSLGPAAR